MPTITTEVDVYVDLSDFDTFELCEELESRGLCVTDEEDSGAVSEAAKDEIYDLYRDFVEWDNNRMPDNGFVLSLKKFFSEQLDKVVL